MQLNDNKVLIDWLIDMIAVKGFLRSGLLPGCAAPLNMYASVSCLQIFKLFFWAQGKVHKYKTLMDKKKPFADIFYHGGPSGESIFGGL